MRLCLGRWLPFGPFLSEHSSMTSPVNKIHKALHFHLAGYASGSRNAINFPSQVGMGLSFLNPKTLVICDREVLAEYRNQDCD
jgi:hypothetical protein